VRSIALRRWRRCAVVAVVCGALGTGAAAQATPPRCRAALRLLSPRDLSRWRGLPDRCPRPGIERWATFGDAIHRSPLGTDRLWATARSARWPTWDEPLRFWFLDDVLVKISIARPRVPDVPRLLWALGAPDARVDAYDATAPVVRPKSEWVWARRGLALTMSSAGDAVMGLAVFAPTSVKVYVRALADREPARECQ